MAAYSGLGLVIGLGGVLWFGWHFFRPLPTNLYWPGWWFRNRELSARRLRAIGVGGVVASAGFIGVVFYPALLDFTIGIGLILAAWVVLILATVGSVRRHETERGPVPPKRALSPSGRRQFTWYVAVLIVAYVIVLATVNWELDRLYPAKTPPPPGGYARTTATVEATNPSDHDQVRYAYAVAGKSFEAVWFADGPEGHASQLRVGQSISIWYEVGDPARSCSCTDPSELQRTTTDPSLIAAVTSLLITAVFALVVARLALGSWQSVSALVRSVTSTQRPASQ